jgi:hypothetical protein
MDEAMDALPVKAPYAGINRIRYEGFVSARSTQAPPLQVRIET